MTDPEDAAGPDEGAGQPAPSDADHLDERLDEALEETFPASDPIAVTPARRLRR